MHIARLNSLFAAIVVLILGVLFLVATAGPTAAQVQPISADSGGVLEFTYDAPIGTVEVRTADRALVVAPSVATKRSALGPARQHVHLYDSSVSSVAPRCRSFSADTEGLLGDGVTTVAISQLEVGDEVWAHDPETGESGPREVEAVWPHYDWLVDLDVEGGSVTTTEDHHFWNDTDQQWQESQHIDRGDDLLAADGDEVGIVGLDWSTLHYAWAFDLTVEGVHSYYVDTGHRSVLVHNCGGLPRFDGPKPTYHVNPMHVPGQGLRTGKTPLPADAEDVFRNAVPNDPDSPTAWFALNTDGQIYRYSPGNDGTAHFSGIDGVGDGVRNLTPYAIDRLDGLAG